MGIFCLGAGVTIAHGVSVLFVKHEIEQIGLTLGGTWVVKGVVVVWWCVCQVVRWECMQGCEGVNCCVMGYAHKYMYVCIST